MHTLMVVREISLMDGRLMQVLSSLSLLQDRRSKASNLRETSV